MPGFSWKKFLIKIAVFFVVYFVLFLIIHFIDIIPYLDNALTGEIETSDVGGIITLSLLRNLFYIGIPMIVTLLFVLASDRSLRPYFRSLVESVNIVYFFLMVIKVSYFFLALDKAFGFSILDGLDLGIFVLTAILNFFCYKKPYFLFIQPKDTNNEKEQEGVKPTK